MVRQRPRGGRADRRPVAPPRRRDRRRRHGGAGHGGSAARAARRRRGRRRGPLAAARADLLPYPPVDRVPVQRHRRDREPGADRLPGRDPGRPGAARGHHHHPLRARAEPRRSAAAHRGPARLVHRAAHPRRGPGDLDQGRPRPGSGLRVRRRGAGVLRGGARRAHRGRRPREDLHQRRPGRRGRALRAARDDRRGDPGRGPGGRGARHLRRRPLRRAWPRSGRPWLRACAASSTRTGSTNRPPRCWPGRASSSRPRCA